jgi:hypothetical protein
MRRVTKTQSIRTILLAALVVAGLLSVASSFAADTTSPFSGKAVNGGSVIYEMKDGKHVLSVSSDFKVPNSPDPHWQVVDSKGNVYLLNRLTLKDDKVNRSITVPAYVPDIVKVQMWCAWAEVVLGEASFAKPVMAHATK